MHVRLARTFRCYRTPSSRVLRVRPPAPLPLGINTSNNYRTFFLLLYAFNSKLAKFDQIRDTNPKKVLVWQILTNAVSCTGGKWQVPATRNTIGVHGYSRL